MVILRLQTNDDEIFEVDTKFLQCSEVITSMLRVCTFNADSLSIPIPLINVSGPIFRKILEWARHHFYNPDPDEVDLDLMSWDDEFVNLDYDVLFEMLHAANFLGIEKLVEQTYMAMFNISRARRAAPEEYFPQAKKKRNGE